MNCHMPRLLEAAAQLGFRAVEAAGTLTVETTTGHTIASCPGGTVSVSKTGDSYTVSYKGVSVETSLPHVAVALAYNAYSQSLLEPHYARIMKALDNLSTARLPEACRDWASRILGVDGRRACRVAVALAAFSAALYVEMGGEGPFDEYREIPEGYPGLQEGLGLARGVCRWPRACDEAKHLADVLSGVKPLSHSRAGHMIASWLAGYNSLAAAAAGHHFLLLTGARSIRVRVGWTGVPLLAAQEASWLAQASLRARVEGFSERAVMVLAYDAVITGRRETSWTPPTVEFCPDGAGRCGKPYISFSRVSRRLAASRALMGERGVYYEYTGVPIAHAVIHGDPGLSLVQLEGQFRGPWDAVLAAANAATREGNVMGLLVPGKG